LVPFKSIIKVNNQIKKKKKEEEEEMKMKMKMKTQLTFFWRRRRF
jgi:hypothetical protein